MASSAAAALLDELMGRTRNCDPNEKPQDIRWEDDVVCKYYLCGFCPHVLFTNTRADLGICNKIHDEAIRKQYEESGRFEKLGYEEEFLQCLQNLISDVEKRIRRGHQRLALNNSQAINGGALTEKEEKINMLTEKINELVNQAEELGSEGKVEEAQGVLKLCDQLKEERTQIQNQSIKDDIPQMKQMEVCDVCGAFLIVDDAPQRQDEHLMGKQHAGYAQVRAEIERRKMKKKAELEERDQKRQREREEQDKALEKEREERRRKLKEKEDRDRRERERERDRERDRDRDRDRRRRSRSRSSGRSSRTKERRRSSSRERRKSKERRRRSGSRSDRSKSSKSSHRSRSRSRDRERSSSRRDRDRRKDDRDRHSKSRSKDGQNGKPDSSSVDKDGNSPARRSDDSGSHSQGDTKTD